MGQLAAEYVGGALSKEYIRMASPFIPSGTRLVAIENAPGNGSPCVTCFVISDDLGSVRLMANNDGSAVARHDYLPFGEEVLAGGTRSAAAGFDAGDGATERFTGKERDSESGLDYFGARYYGSALGRFSSPDEPLGDQSPADPQSWNLYSYVRNSPLVNTDPTGEDCVTTSDQTDKSVTVTIAAGTCNGNGGTYVNGTVDKGSLTYNGTSVGFSYASYDSSVSLGAGTINLGPSRGGDINPFGLAVIQSVGRQTNSMYGLMGTFAGGSLLGGSAVAGGLAFTASGAGLTTIGAITPLLPAVPSALEKLQKIGLSLEEANQLVESPDSQKLVDNLNSGNINVIKEVGGKLIRVTLDPTGSRIISAGQVRANSITNGIANGRFTPR